MEFNSNAPCLIFMEKGALLKEYCLKHTKHFDEKENWMFLFSWMSKQ